MDDTIYRQAAIDACIRVREYRAYDEIEEIKALPPAQPGRKSAYLIDPNPYGKCSSCGQLIDIRDEYNYCPNCGARMKEGDKNGA